MSAWTILPITEQHDRSQFDCGEPSLDQYLKQYARQNEEKGISRTYVLLRKGEQRILGYYTLAAGQFEPVNLAPSDAKQLPKYPVPVVVLARLATDRSMQGKQLGRRLLEDAFRRSFAVSKQIGCYAIFVLALHAKAANFYREKFGFIPFADDPLHLYLPMSTIRAVIDSLATDENSPRE